MEPLIAALDCGEGASRSTIVEALGQIGDPRAVRAFNQAREADAVLLRQLVDRLVAMYEQQPGGFIRGSSILLAQEIRKVGEQLLARGGHDLMLEAHAAFASRCRFPGVARNLEQMWDGIGRWRG